MLVRLCCRPLQHVLSTIEFAIKQLAFRILDWSELRVGGAVLGRWGGVACVAGRPAGENCNAAPSSHCQLHPTLHCKDTRYKSAVPAPPANKSMSVQQNLPGLGLQMDGQDGRRSFVSASNTSGILVSWLLHIRLCVIITVEKL